MTFYKSLTVRLSFTVFLILLGFSIFQERLTAHALRTALTESSEREAKIEAAQFALELKEHTTPYFKQDSVDALLYKYGSVKGNHVFFIADSEGVIKASSLPGLQVERVSISQLKSFCKSNPTLPLYLSDPRAPKREIPFAAAPLEIENTQGYFVVLLEDAMSGRERGILWESTGRWFLLNLCIALIAGFIVSIVLIRILTKRLSILASAMQEYRPGSSLTIDDNTGDEVSALTGAFVKMADTIAKQFGLLKERDALRRELIAGVSHDLRTPLASVKGYLQKLQEQVDKGTLNPERLTEFLGTISRNANKLDELVNSLFELSQFEEIKERMNYSVFPVRPLLEQLVERFIPAGRKSEIEVAIGQCGVDITMKGDASLVERAVANVVDNAIRYSKSGGKVIVSCSSSEHGVTISVQDSGPGIPSEMRSKIFEKFYRGDFARREGGAGLGLAITARIIEAHNGRIEVGDSQGAGAIFHLIFPK